MRDQNKMRMEILSIQNDPLLSLQEKSRKVQEVMTRDYRKFLSNSMESIGSNCVSESDENVESVRSYHCEKSKVMGCPHYKRACKIRGQCCDKWFVCRLCHDEAMTHQIDRYSIKEMKCMYCDTVQEVAKSCINCKKDMAEYYCDVCHLWDNDDEKKIYHCEKCGLCRVGQGEDYFHCDKCNVCMAVNLKGKHKCIERNLESNCPICHEFMFTSTSTIIFMKCGHCIHHSCYKKHVETSYTCPICVKSLGDMTEYFKKIDAVLKSHSMPPEYQDSISEIFCNDCEQKSSAAFHFQFHKCVHCQSYNTAVTNVIHPLKNTIPVMGPGA